MISLQRMANFPVKYHSLGGGRKMYDVNKCLVVVFESLAAALQKNYM